MQVSAISFNAHQRATYLTMTMAMAVRRELRGVLPICSAT